MKWITILCLFFFNTYAFGQFSSEYYYTPSKMVAGAHFVWNLQYGSLFQYDKTTLELVGIFNSSNSILKSIRELEVDRDGKVYVCSGSLYQFQPTTNSWYKRSEVCGSTSEIGFDSKNKPLVLGTQFSLSPCNATKNGYTGKADVYNGPDGRFYARNSYSWVCGGGGGGCACSIENKGLTRSSKNSGDWTSLPGAGFYYAPILVDTFGYNWIKRPGMSDSTKTVYNVSDISDPTLLDSFFIFEGYPNATIISFQSDNTLWFRNATGIYTYLENVITRKSDYDPLRVYSISFDQQLFAISGSRDSIYSLQQGEWRAASTQISSDYFYIPNMLFLAGTDEHKWFATFSKIITINNQERKEKSVASIPFSYSFEIKSSYEDSLGRLWLYGSDNSSGNKIFSLDGDSWTDHSIVDSFSVGVNNISFDFIENQLWMIPSSYTGTKSFSFDGQNWTTHNTTDTYNLLKNPNYAQLVWTDSSLLQIRKMDTTVFAVPDSLLGTCGIAFSTTDEINGKAWMGICLFKSSFGIQIVQVLYFDGNELQVGGEEIRIEHYYQSFVKEDSLHLFIQGGYLSPLSMLVLKGPDKVYKSPNLIIPISNTSPYRTTQSVSDLEIVQGKEGFLVNLNYILSIGEFPQSGIGTFSSTFFIKQEQVSHFAFDSRFPNNYKIWNDQVGNLWLSGKLSLITDAQLAPASFIAGGNVALCDNVGLYAAWIDAGSRFNFKWSDGSENPNRLVVPADHYSIHSDNSKGTSIDKDIELNLVVPPLLNEVVDSASSSNASDGIITFSVSGDFPPFEVEWEDGNQSSFRENLTAGAYLIKITDNNGCEYFFTVEVPFIIKTGLREFQNSPPMFTLAPNPTRDYVKIDLIQPELTEVTILNVFGSAMTQVWGKDQLSIDVSDWSPGIYFVKLSSIDGKIKQTKKLVVK